jgi:hypothetical protein
MFQMQPNQQDMMPSPTELDLINKVEMFEVAAAKINQNLKNRNKERMF